MCHCYLSGYISPAPSAPPTSVSVPEVTPSVQWGPVDCIHRNGDITGYTVRVRASGEGERTVSVDESVRKNTMCGLTPFTEYTVSVAAENSVDIGVYSNMITIRTQGNEQKDYVIRAEGLPFCVCLYYYTCLPYLFCFLLVFSA